MSRVEKNKALLESLRSIDEDNLKGSFEQIVVTHMGMAIGVLIDISGSLAVIADTMKERNENHE